MEEIRLYGTTNGSGALTVNGEKAVEGYLYAVEWIDGTFSNGVGAVISFQNRGSGVAITVLTLTAANDDDWYFPRELVHDASGNALIGTAGGDRCMPLVTGTPRMVVSSGGASKDGGCILYIKEF